MKTIILILTVSLSLLSCKKNSGQGSIDQKPPDKISEQKTINLKIDGNDRSFIVYLPIGYNNAGKMPMIFVIHGGAGTPEGMINIANFKNNSDLLPIFLAVSIVDLIVIIIAKYTKFFGRQINVWYEKLGMTGVLLDIFIIVIGLLITRWIFTYFSITLRFPKWNGRTLDSREVA